MRMRKIGTTDIEASVVALGAWAIGGGPWWGESDDQQSISGWGNRLMGLSTFFTTPTICQDIQYLFILIFPFKSSFFVLIIVIE